MKDTIIIVQIDSKYCDYLRKYDNRVSYNAGEKILRPFVGILFEINQIKYFAPLSSPKKKHLLMKDNQDFFRLDKGQLGAINFNNMIPVLKNSISEINLNKPCKNKREQNYQNLLQKQLFWLNRNKEKIYYKAWKLYNNYKNDKLPISLKNRCCNFILLEEKCLEYNYTENKH